MKRRSWKVWVAGITLAQVLVIGADSILLWPTPSEAEKVAARLEIGMNWVDVIAPFLSSGSGMPWHCTTFIANNSSASCTFQDGSQLRVTLAHRFDQPITSISTTPPGPIHPLTRLRRLLARALPFLGE
jgi:hypothetical protein